MENILFWIIVGVIAGWLARVVIPAEVSGGIFTDFTVGIIGALIGGFLFSTVIMSSYQGWIASTGVAFVGALILLSILRIFSGSKKIFHN